MNEDGNLARSDPDSKQNTQVLRVSGQPDQGMESENSSGSVYHSSPQLLTATEHVEEGPIKTSAATSESDSDQHFSDAIQDSDDGSVYSAEENFPAAEEDKPNLNARSSHDQWSPSSSKVSVLPNHSDAHSFTSKIPLPTHVPRSASSGSLQLQLALEKAEGSLIPVPIRFQDRSRGLQETGNELKVESRSASPDKDAPSSESENLTAISVKAPNNDGALEKYKSDDLLGDPVSFPLDVPEVAPDCGQTAITAGCVENQNNEDAVSTVTQDSDVSTFTLSDVRTHRYESENERPHQQHTTVAFTEVKFSAQPYDTSDNEDCTNQDSMDDKEDADDASRRAEMNVAIETIQMVELDRIQLEECLPPPKIQSLQVVNDPEGRSASSIAFLAPIMQAATEPITLAEETQTSAIETQLSEDNSLNVISSTEDSRIISEDQINDDDYVEIEEEPSQKKLTRFGKLKNKLSGKSSSKEVNTKKSGTPAKTTLKVRRKPPKSPGSRPSSAKRPPTPPVKTSPTVLRPKGNTIPQSKVGSIRASIKQEAERLKDDRGISIKKRSNSDIAIMKRNDSFTELKEGRSSSHSIRDIFQDPTSQSSKDIKSPSSSSVKNQKTAKEEVREGPVLRVLSPVNQSKLNNIVLRYRTQMRKFKTQVSDMTELQSKTGLLKESLTQLKTQIVSIAGVMPSYLNEVPDVPVLTTNTSSGSNTEFMSSASSALEDVTAECLALKDDITKKFSTINNLNKDVKALRDENSDLKESLNSTKKQMLAQQKTYEEKLANMENLKDEAMRSRRMLETFRRKNEAFAKNMHEAKVMQDEERSRRAENEKLLVAEISTLKTRLNFETSKRETMKQGLTKITEEKETLDVQVASLTQITKELKQKLTEQEKEVNKTREIQVEYEALEDAFHRLEKELAESKKYCESLASRIDSSEKAEEETSKKLIELSEEVMNKIKMIEKLSEQKTTEQKRRTELYKIISDLSAFTGTKIDSEEIQEAAEEEQCELTNPIVKIFENLEGVMNTKEAEIERQKQAVSDLQNLHQEKQSLIEQLYEFVNEKNASICQRSESRDIVSDNKEEEKTVERSSNLNTLEGQPSLKDHPEFQDLYNMLEVKRHTLLRMESQIRRLQEVHAYCGMRRTMQESRIAELETMLAHCLN